MPWARTTRLTQDFGILHTRNLTPVTRHLDARRYLGDHGGCVAVSIAFGGRRRAHAGRHRSHPARLLVQLWLLHHARQAWQRLPNTLLTVTLASNFGTFLLYALSCLLCIVAYKGHENYHPVTPLPHPGARSLREHGLHDLLSCRSVHGLRHQDGALCALGIAAVWGIYGAFHFLITSKQEQSRAA